MIKISELLDEAKIKNGWDSDYRLAKSLDISKQDVSAYRASKKFPDEYACVRLAQAVGRDPLEIIKDVQLLAEKSDKRRAFWRSFHTFGRRGTTGLLLVLTFILPLLGQGASKNPDRVFYPRRRFA